MKRYLIDKLAAGMLDGTVAAIVAAKKKIKKPIQSVVLWHDSAETFIAQEVLLNFTPGPPRGYQRSDLQLDIDTPETAVPTSQYTVEEDGDPVRDAFIRAQKTDKKAEWWAESLAVPRLLVFIEIDRAMAGLKDALKAAGVPLAPKLTVYNGDPDKTEPLRKEGGLDDAVRDDLRAKLKTAAQKKAFAELCYDDPKRQAWLLKLAGA